MSKQLQLLYFKGLNIIVNVNYKDETYSSNLFKVFKPVSNNFVTFSIAQNNSVNDFQETYKYDFLNLIFLFPLPPCFKIITWGTFILFYGLNCCLIVEFKIKPKGGAQFQSICLACSIPCVQSLTYKQTKSRQTVIFL